MSSNRFMPTDIFNERKETLFNAFKAIYEKLILYLTNNKSISSKQINLFIESTVKNNIVSEREQFIYYLINIITKIAKSTNMKVPEFITQFQDDVKDFDKKYDKDGNLSKMLFKYFSKEYSNKNNLVGPNIKSFFPYLLGFSYEAHLVRAMLFDLRAGIITSQNNFSSFMRESKQKFFDIYQKQISRYKIESQKNSDSNELVLKEREKVISLEKNIKILFEENDKFKLKIEGEILKVVNLINSLKGNESQRDANFQITFDELNKQCKSLIKALKSDPISNKDFIKIESNPDFSQSPKPKSDEKYESIEKVKFIKELKQKDDTILKLRTQLNDLKVELLRSSLNKTNSSILNQGSPSSIKSVERFSPHSISSKHINVNESSDLLNEYYTASEKNHDINESLNEIQFDSNAKSRKSRRSIELKNESETSIVSNDQSSIISQENTISPFKSPSINKHKHEIEELKRQLKQSKSVIEQLTNENKKKEKVIYNLNKSVEENSSKFDALFDKIQLLRQKNRLLKKSQQTNINDSSNSAGVYCSTRENLLVEQISEKTNEIIFKDSIIIELENDNRKLQAQIEMMKENNSISSRQMTRLKDDIQYIQDSSINDLNQLLRELDEKKRIINKQASIISEFQKIKDRSDKYEKIKIENKRLKEKYLSDVQKVFEINENLKNKYASLKEKYNALSQQNQQGQKDIQISKYKIQSPIKQSDYHSEASSSNNNLSISDSYK